MMLARYLALAAGIRILVVHEAAHATSRQDASNPQVGVGVNLGLALDRRAAVSGLVELEILGINTSLLEKGPGNWQGGGYIGQFWGNDGFVYISPSLGYQLTRNPSLAIGGYAGLSARLSRDSTGTEFGLNYGGIVSLAVDLLAGFRFNVSLRMFNHHLSGTVPISSATVGVQYFWDPPQ